MISQIGMVVLPETWPPPPSMVSFSSMSDIEACPRRWALANAKYPGIWDRQGYPERIGYGAARGQVVHASVELLIKTFSSKGCGTLRSKEAVAVLHELGGFTTIIQKAVAQLIQNQRLNPRMDNVLWDLARRLMKDIPGLKSLVQEMLVRTEFATISSESAPRTRTNVTNSAVGDRTSLGLGSHAEVILRSEEIGWMGIADLITITPNSCEIRDFKTGAEETYHANQIKTYAALWYTDRRLNPGATIADRLILSYPDHDSEVPTPDADEMNQILAHLKQRRDGAMTSLSLDPPKAIPSGGNCQWCSVKHLCNDYWDDEVQQRIANEEVEIDRTVDAQLRLDERLDSLQWLATVDCAGFTRTGTKVTIILQAPDEDLRAGGTIRVVGARTLSRTGIDNEGNRIPTIEFISTTERYVMA